MFTRDEIETYPDPGYIRATHPYVFDRIEVRGQTFSGEPVYLSLLGQFWCEFPGGPANASLALRVARLLKTGGYFSLLAARRLDPDLKNAAPFTVTGGTAGLIMEKIEALAGWQFKGSYGTAVTADGDIWGYTYTGPDGERVALDFTLSSRTGNTTCFVSGLPTRLKDKWL